MPNKNSKILRGGFSASITPTLRDLEWAAGFLEGEGSFWQNGGYQTASAAQVNPEPIAKLLMLFGGRATKRNAAKNAQGTSPLWWWEVYGARARGVMMTLYPLLSVKRQGQIRDALVVKAKIEAAAAAKLIQTQEKK